MDPIDVNPCSYLSVGEVFKTIQKDSERQWNIVGCDGLPYLLGARLIERHHTCPICSFAINNTADFENHLESNHNDNNINTDECKTYGNILLLPGLGHYEINITKALFKLLWPVIFIDLAKMLGFRTIKALTCCEAATNHHKSWQILQIFLKGTSRELLLPYVRS